MEPVIRKILKHGNERWEVDYGVDEYGNRRRPVFKTDDEAAADLDKWKKEVKRAGDYWAKLEPTKPSSFVATLREMDGRGVTVSEVWHEWQENEKRGQTKLVQMPYKDVVVEWKDVKLAAGKSPRRRCAPRALDGETLWSQGVVSLPATCGQPPFWRQRRRASRPNLADFRRYRRCPLASRWCCTECQG
jgi:hypothetical protein